MMPWLLSIASNLLLASLLALGAWFMQRGLRRHAIAHVLWLLALVKLVTPPLVSVPLPGSPGVLACTLGVCGCERHAPAQTLVREKLPWALLAVWAAGAGATVWVAWRRWTRFRRLFDGASPVPPDWQSLAAQLAAELSIRRPPEILMVAGRLPPLVVPGFSRPRMLLPAALVRRLNAAERSSLLLHELVHIRRGDHLVRILELAVRLAYWWLPFVGTIGRQLRACEETCCDAAVLAHLPHARRDYARLLLDVLDFADPLPGKAAAQATAMSAAKGLEQRLRAILDGGKRTRSAWPSVVLAVALACIILPCQLHYVIVRPATTTQQPLDATAGSVNGESEGAHVRDFCCPVCR
jgi:bla regulator protein blaR1